MQHETPVPALPSQAEQEAFIRKLKKERRGKGQWPLFKTFLTRVLQFLGFPKATRIQNDIADYLQFGPKSAIIQAFRGVGKSFVTTAFVLWTLDNDPQAKIMVVSANGRRAAQFTQFALRLIADMPELSHLLPDKSKKQRESALGFDVGPAIPSDSPSVKCVGITGQLTGSRADLIVADDVEVPTNSFTMVMRERLAELVKEFVNVLKPLPTSRTLYLGTPQTEQSLYNVLHAERGYAIRVWPARVPEDPSVYKGNLAPIVVKMIEDKVPAGTPTDPARFDHAVLVEKELESGRSSFKLQFQLDTTMSDAERYPLKLHDLIVMSLDHEKGPREVAWGRDRRTAIDDLQSVGFSGDNYWGPIFTSEDFVPWQGSVMAIDPAGRGGDETAYAVVRMLHGRLYLVASGGMRGGYTEENLTALAQLAKTHRVNEVVLETNFGDGMFGALLKPYLTRIWPVGIHETRASGQKELRILDTLEPVVQQHRLVVDRAVIEKDLADSETYGPAYSLFHQLTRITRDKGALGHDDRLDALEMAVSYWIEQMEVDTHRASQNALEEALLAEMDAICEGGPLSVRGAVEAVFDRPQGTGNFLH